MYALEDLSVRFFAEKRFLTIDSILSPVATGELLGA